MEAVFARRLLLLLFLRVSISPSGLSDCLVATKQWRTWGAKEQPGTLHTSCQPRPRPCPALQVTVTKLPSSLPGFFSILRAFVDLSWNGSTIRTMVCLCTEVSVIIKESTEQLTGLIQCNVITFMPKKKKKWLSHTRTQIKIDWSLFLLHWKVKTSVYCLKQHLGK